MRPGTLGGVVRRVLLRRNIAIDAEIAQLIADAVQAALQAGAASPPPRRLAPSPHQLRAAVLTWHRRPASFGAGDTFVTGTRYSRVARRHGPCQT